MKSIFLPGLALLLSLTSTMLAQENGELGRMWTFENPPCRPAIVLILLPPNQPARYRVRPRFQPKNENSAPPSLPPMVAVRKIR